jgi:PAS domain S-box-containing protein
MKFILGKKTTYFYILSVIILTMVLLVFYVNNQEATASGERMMHAHKVIGKSHDILLDAINVETGFRGFLLSKDERFLEPFDVGQANIGKDVDTLILLTKDIPKHKILVASLKKNSEERVLYAKKYIERQRHYLLSDKEKINIIVRGKVLTDQLRSSIDAITKEELKWLKLRKEENKKSNQLSGLLFILLLLFLIIIFILMVIIVKNQNAKNDELETYTADQKLASQYALSLIEASLDPLVTISVEGKIMDTNQATVNITGVERIALIGSDFFDYFTEPQKAREVYQEVFQNGSVADAPLTLRNINGKLTDVLFNGSVYKDEKGIILGVVIVARDVTDQKRVATELIEARIFAELATEIAEEEKRNAQDASVIAENAVKAKQQFLSNMSHEIRTPMNAIIGFTKVLLKTNLTPKQIEYLSAIQMSGDSLIVLINDILDLAKVDAGKMTFERIPFRLSASISAMLHVFETKIQEKNLELITEYDANIPLVLLVDPVRLHQIILNLVSNAIKFTSKGKITVSVLLVDESEKNVRIKFVISDTGIGIEESKIDTIFDDFQQATTGTARLYGGTGLGLAIVKQLVESQGGIVDVKSKIDEGSTFSFMLNFPKTDEETQLIVEEVEEETEIRILKVLVVEDMPLNQLLMKTLLDDFGFERDIAENGKIAIEMLENNEYDIILMDLQMPVMNGFETTEYIRNTLKLDLPIIALTADVTTVDLEKCKAVGMNDYIPKPIDERILLSKIAGVVKKTVKKAQKNNNNQRLDKSLNTKFINLDYLNTRTKSNPKLMMEMISIYLQQTPPIIEAMKQSILDKDWELLASAVHKIIPSFSIMGMSPDLENMAKKIQEDANALNFTAETAELAMKLEASCIQAYKELEIEFNLIKNTQS